MVDCRDTRIYVACYSHRRWDDSAFDFPFDVRLGRSGCVSGYAQVKFFPLFFRVDYHFTPLEVCSLSGIWHVVLPSDGPLHKHA